MGSIKYPRHKKRGDEEITNQDRYMVPEVSTMSEQFGGQATKKELDIAVRKYMDSGEYILLPGDDIKLSDRGSKYNEVRFYQNLRQVRGRLRKLFIYLPHNKSSGCRKDLPSWARDLREEIGTTRGTYKMTEWGHEWIRRLYEDIYPMIGLDFKTVEEINIEKLTAVEHSILLRFLQDCYSYNNRGLLIYGDSKTVYDRSQLMSTVTIREMLKQYMFPPWR